MSINNDIIEINPIKININDIFDKKIELGPLLQFNLLQKVIEEFINRQNKTNDKINKLEIKINNICKSNSKNKDNYEDLEDENEIDKNDFNINNITEGKYNKNLDNKLENKKNDSNNNLNESNFSKELNEFKNINEENINTKNEKSNSYLNNKIINQLYTKINKLENKYEELLDNISSLNKFTKKEFQSIKDKNNDYTSKFTKQAKLINDMNDKLAGFDIYDVIKGDSNDINVDKAIVLTKAIEKNLLKKIEFSDLRNKTNEEAIFKLKNELTNMKNSNDQLSRNIDNKYNKLLNDNESKLKIINRNSDDIFVLKKIIDNSISKNDLINYKNEQNEKIKEILKNVSQKKEGSKEEKVNTINTINEDLESYINKKLENNEKSLNNNITNSNIDLINKEIIKIKQDLNKNKIKENFDSINSKIEEIEQNFKEQMDETKNDLYYCDDKCSKTIRMLEYLRTQIFNLKREENKEKIDNNKIEENDNNDNIDIDLSLFITKNSYDEEINKIYKKIDKIANLETDNYRNIQNIEGRLKYLASESDLTNIEQYLINIIDENKIKDSKKYVDKGEFLKSFKYLELQLKHLNEITSKENENWLLAKKPINSYMCASCEAYIGDLKNKDEYSAWNKIPAREDHSKRYRFGHGFSNMLKMVNMDLLKKVQRVNSGINIGIKIDESKKVNKKSLPKINMQNQIDNINFNNEVNDRFHSERLDNTERVVNKSINININSVNNSFRNSVNDDGQPKVIKIYKKNKK